MGCMLMTFAFNAVAGASIAVASGFAAETGAVVGSVAGLIPMGGAGMLRAGVFTEIWTGEMIKAFRTAPESLGWMQRIRSYNQYVQHDRNPFCGNRWRPQCACEQHDLSTCHYRPHRCRQTHQP